MSTSFLTARSRHRVRTPALRTAILTAHAEAARWLNRDITDEMAVPSYLKGNWFSRQVFWGRLRHVVKQAELRPGGTVFDFGCGTGVLLPLLAAEGRKVFATDLHLEIARNLMTEHQLGRVELIAAEQWRTAVPEGRIDTIVAADVLEHIEDRREVLSAMGRKLSARGRLVICGPTENWLYRLGRRIVGFSGHYHVTAIDQVLADARAVGLRQVALKSFPLSGPFCLFQIAAFIPKA